VAGQLSGGRLSSMISGASFAAFMYWLNLSTETIWFAREHWLWTEKTNNILSDRP
jgi:hypothetical protein